MADNANFDVNNRVTIITVVLIGSLAGFVLLTAPALVGAFLSQMHFTPQQAGLLISADMAGMGLATLPALFWLGRLNWRRVAFVALVLNALCHLLSAFIDSYYGLMTTRFIAGLFAGSAMSVCLASIGLTRDKDRNFSFWIVGQLVLGAAGLALLPKVVELWSLKPVYLIAALGTAALSALVGFLPAGSAIEQQKIEKPNDFEGSILLKAVLGVIAVYCFYVALSGVWAFLERIGFVAGISAITIGQCLSIASLGGIAGALSAAGLSNRYGRSAPVTQGFMVVIGALAILMDDNTTLAYFIAACLFKYAWTFILPFMLAALAMIDSSGRVIVTTNIFIGGGLATGPALAATLIEGLDYSPIIWFGISGMLLSFLCILPLLGFEQARLCLNKAGT